MRAENWTIKGAFGIIGEIFDELSHAEEAWNACGWGESVFETIDEAILTYKHEVEKMNEKVGKMFSELCICADDWRSNSK